MDSRSNPLDMATQVSAMNILDDLRVKSSWVVSNTLRSPSYLCLH